LKSDNRGYNAEVKINPLAQIQKTKEAEFFAERIKNV
jgi:hypothetical protein